MRYLWIIFFYSSSCFAFTLVSANPARFSVDTIAINVSPNECLNVGITKEDLLSIATDAADSFWNQVTSSRVKFSRGTITGPSASDMSSSTLVSNWLNSVGSTNIIQVACVSNYYDAFPNTTLAVGGIASNNVHYIFVNDQSGSSFANLPRSEMVSTLAHEMGHAFGLGHSPIPESLMFYQSKKGREALEWDDWDGLTYLYPITKLKDSCGTIKDIQDDAGKGPKNFISLLLGILIPISLKLRKKSQNLC